MKLYPKLILDALEKVRYPGTGQNLVESGMVDDDIRIDGMKVSFTLIFDKPNDPFTRSVVKAAEASILAYVSPDVEIKGNISTTSRQEIQPVGPASEEAPLLPGVKHIIAVASGKGGVGKSTVSANLAVALAAAGYRVGLLDADIFGPSQPKMSIGFFVNPDEAVLWRGAMACNALKQLISEANWGELDYLLIDLPPGTSDIHLTLVQTLALTGAVIVSTPQQVALADARKGISMFVDNKVNVPVLGLVENMAWFTPAELPENRYYIFGREGCKRLAEELGVPLLGQIPLVQSICESGDVGEPAALDEDTVTGMAFRQLAERVVERVAYREQHMAPTQKVEITHS